MKRWLIVMGSIASAGLAWAAETPPCDAACREAKGFPVPTYRAQPQYPVDAARRRIEGCVTVSFEILPDGRADKYVVVDSQPPGVFDQATLLAFNEWTFKVPDRPGRYAQTIEYRMSPPPTNAGAPPSCVKPGFAELNPGAGS